MNRYFKTVLLAPIILTGFSSQAFAGIERSSSDCHQVGVIIKSDEPGLNGSLCKGDRLIVNQRVLISCKYNSFFDWVNTGEYDIERFCASSLTPQRNCADTRSCFRNVGKLYLKGQTFATQAVKPRLEWEPIAEAKGYSLLIQSSDGKEIYRDQVTSPEYQFIETLRPGELYQVEISVMGKQLSERFALYVLAQENIEEMNSMMEIIDSGNWTEVEKALFRDGVYTRYGLTLEAVENLEQSPDLKRSSELQARLANVYFNAGYFEKGRQILENLEQTSSEAYFPQVR